jgi:hypothetical protein
MTALPLKVGPMLRTRSLRLACGDPQTDHRAAGGNKSSDRI